MDWEILYTQSDLEEAEGLKMTPDTKNRDLNHPRRTLTLCSILNLQVI